jgi:predicted transcriptional regulator
MLFNIFMDFIMTALSIVIPDDLAKASKEVAKQLGFSRTEFIRQAIIHELHYVKKQLEQQLMVKSIKAMKNSPEYLEEIEDMETLDSHLPEDEEEWWSK